MERISTHYTQSHIVTSIHKVSIAKGEQLKQNLNNFKASTSATEIEEPPMEDTVLPYLVGIDCDIGKGEYGNSDSLTG